MTLSQKDTDTVKKALDLALATHTSFTPCQTFCSPSSVTWYPPCPSHSVPAMASALSTQVPTLKTKYSGLVITEPLHLGNCALREATSSSPNLPPNLMPTLLLPDSPLPGASQPLPQRTLSVAAHAAQILALPFQVIRCPF